MANFRIVIIPEITGNEGDVIVRITNSPFKTRDDVSFKYLDPDFGYWLLNELYEIQKIFAGTKGIFTKIPFCPDCKAELVMARAINEQEKFELKYKELAPFYIMITLPWVECPICGRKCCIDLKGLMSFNLNEAIINAFRSKNIKP